MAYQTTRMFSAFLLLGYSSLCWPQNGLLAHIETSQGAPTGPCAPQQVTLDLVNKRIYVCPDIGTWSDPFIVNASSGIPVGFITLVTSGTCPTGFSEVTSLNGKFLQGTLAANGDVGVTGGSASITPTGTVSQPIFTGSQGTTSAVSAGTPAGTNGTVTSGATSAGTPAGTNTATATSGNCAATNIAAGTGSTTACKATAPNLTVPAETFTGSALVTHTHSVPAETFTGSALATHTHTLTPSGSVSQPTLAMNAIDPSPAFVRVIFCSKN